MDTKLSTILCCLSKRTLYTGAPIAPVHVEWCGGGRRRKSVGVDVSLRQAQDSEEPRGRRKTQGHAQGRGFNASIIRGSAVSRGKVRNTTGTDGIHVAGGIQTVRRHAVSTGSRSRAVSLILNRNTTYGKILHVAVGTRAGHMGAVHPAKSQVQVLKVLRDKTSRLPYISASLGI